MNTKSDWQAVRRRFLTGGGEPPTAEKMLTYTRGELSEEEEAEVRAQLVAYPDLVRALSEPFPEPAEPGDPDYMSDADFEKHWKVLRTRLPAPTPEPRVLQFWRWSAALAAALALVFGTLLWQTRARLDEPHAVWEEQVLFPDGRRGPEGEVATLTAQGDPVLLVTPLIGQLRFDEYRLEMVDVRAERIIWKSASMRPRDDDAFALLVPRRFLRQGEYRIVVYGVAGKAEERLATYSLRVP